MTYKERTFGYKLLRPIFKLFFKLYFNPKVIGINNIPRNGSFILCGNHKNVHDQFPIMIHTKRVIHYMAKKEYFDGKMGWFFRFVGQISVNREIHDSDAKDEAIHILLNGGALGIFPEGTRNSLIYKIDMVDSIYEEVKSIISKKEFLKIIDKNQTKLSQMEFLQQLNYDERISKEDYKNYILNVDNSLKTLVSNRVITKKEYDASLFLPLKYGAVSMANKTNSKIVPFAIKGHYKFRSHDLEIKIGVPIEMTGNLEKDNEILEENIKKLLLD